MTLRNVYTPDESIMSWAKTRLAGKRDKIETARKAYAKQIIEFVKADLGKKGFQEISLKWNSKAGCPCGCSPAYVISAGKYRGRVLEPEFGRADRKDVLFYTMDGGKLKFSTSNCKIFIPGGDGTRRYGDWSMEQKLKKWGFKKGTEKTIATTKDFGNIGKVW